MPTPKLADLSHTWPVYGHEWAVLLLQRAGARADKVWADRASNLRHAYLFLGSGQIGKTTLAKAFSQTLLCSNSVQQPCGECRACHLMVKGNHPDFRLVQPLDKEGYVDRADGTLRAEQAAEIVREAALRPLESQYKIFLIQDFHAANDSFANKLLKTLEEPPDHVILCLTALDRASLLPTIVSRCQVLELRPLDPGTIERALIKGWRAEPTRARLLARLANGRMGWAIQQLENEQGDKERLEQLQTLWRLIAANRLERLAFAEQSAAERNNQRLFRMLDLWSSWWRDIMLAQSGCADQCHNIDQTAEILRHARSISPSAVQEYLHTLQRIESYLHHTINTRLALEVLLLRLPGNSSNNSFAA